VGAVARDNQRARFGLIQDDQVHRRFSAARATYLAWTSGAKDSRLITNAVTRDQQASRAFAAELLVPAAYLRSQATGRKLPSYKADEIAYEANVSPWVVQRQAANNHLEFVAA